MREDNTKLQVLVNKVLRSLTGLGRDTPVSVLCEVSGKLSVHQRTALYTLTSIHKAMLTKKPLYSYENLVSSHDPPQHNLRKPSGYTIDYKLSISRGSFYYRGSRLYNQLPVCLTAITNMNVFKTKAKRWVKEFIPLQPPWDQQGQLRKYGSLK